MLSSAKTEPQGLSQGINDKAEVAKGFRSTGNWFLREKVVGMAASSNRVEEADSVFRLISTAPRPRELTGAIDLISHFGLRAHHDHFCKKPLPASIAETPYLNNVVGDTEIRKGEGMELGQLIQDLPTMDVGPRIQPFDLERLRQAFELRETGPIHLPEADKGLLTISGKVKHDHKDKDKKHKKHKDKDKDKDKDKEKDKEHKKHKHRHKDKDKDKDKKKDKSGSHENGDDRSKKHHKKKRKHDGNEEEGDSHKHKKRKHKDSKGDDAGQTKNGM